MRALVLALVVAGCGVSGDNALDPDSGDDGAGGGSGAEPDSCSVGVMPAQPLPVAGPGVTVRAIAQVRGSSGVLTYAWHVQFAGAAVAFTAVSDTAIDFEVPTPGVYAVSLEVSGSSPPCPAAAAPFNIGALGAQSETVRMRVVPPNSIAVPPMEKMFVVKGGGDADLGVVGVDVGAPSSAAVLGPGSTGVAAYLQFSPTIAPDAVVEAFSDASGAATAQLAAGIAHTVLVVPSGGIAIAPRRIVGWFAGGAIQLDAGIAVTGAVLGPAGTPLAGAKVRLASDGVPSTVATTAGDGSFALRVAPGASITVTVAPPEASGLPRLSATSPSFDLGAAMQIRYAANVALRDLAGTIVRRGEDPRPGARLTVIGALPAIGQVTAGAAVVASGDVRIAATAGTGGVLPTVLVPSAQLQVVVEVTAGDLAVVALDTTAGAPANVDAPEMQLITTAALADGGGGLPGATVDLVPAGALAMANAPTLRLTAVAGGAIARSLPSGGRYRLRFQDPKRRAAPLIVDERPITAIAPSYVLPRAIQIQGALRLGGTAPLPGASVQILCVTCTGVDRNVPLAEVVSDATGRFTLAVHDPGTR